ncbi:hypothetical protein GCM10023203_00950 [Actinomycetospora straminea]|uniref:Uncharacterized protein n=1 Tax=Actinomycetospora straminea TaxID=663607 RepID=A0ABP9DRP5_9PSEU
MARVPDLHTGGAPALGDQAARPGGHPGHAGLAVGDPPQLALDHHPPAAQSRAGRQLAVDRRRGLRVHRHRLGAAGEQRVDHLGHLGAHHVEGLRPERVRVVELHHPAPRPLLVADRTGVVVDQPDPVAAPGQPDGGDEPGGSCADDDGVHGGSRGALTDQGTPVTAGRQAP